MLKGDAFTEFPELIEEETGPLPTAPTGDTLHSERWWSMRLPGWVPTGKGGVPEEREEGEAAEATTELGEQEEKHRLTSSMSFTDEEEFPGDVLKPFRFASP